MEITGFQMLTYVGTVVRGPHFGTSTNGISKCEFYLNVPYENNKYPPALYFVTVWRDQAEKMKQVCLAMGDIVQIAGQAGIKSWTDDKTNLTRYCFEMKTVKSIEKIAGSQV